MHVSAPMTSRPRACRGQKVTTTMASIAQGNCGLSSNSIFLFLIIIYKVTLKLTVFCRVERAPMYNAYSCFGPKLSGKISFVLIQVFICLCVGTCFFALSRNFSIYF